MRIRKHNIGIISGSYEPNKIKEKNKLLDIQKLLLSTGQFIEQKIVFENLRLNFLDSQSFRLVKLI